MDYVFTVYGGDTTARFAWTLEGSRLAIGYAHGLLAGLRVAFPGEEIILPETLTVYQSNLEAGIEWPFWEVSVTGEWSYIPNGRTQKTEEAVREEIRKEIS